ncbi:hypothetical protein PMIN07_008615 [Paraphaeosphaeria minitans]
MGETSTLDLRQKCPICYASVEIEGMGTFQNHIANNLERIVAFSLPVDMSDDSDGGSLRASREGTIARRYLQPVDLRRAAITVVTVVKKKSYRINCQMRMLRLTIMLQIKNYKLPLEHRDFSLSR